MALRIIALLLALSGAPAMGQAAGLRLLMLDQAGCAWCEAWRREIGPVYPLTAEGRAAPLSRADFRSTPHGVTFDRPVRFTPTFVLLRDGVEVGRIEGYPGEDFFWGLLGRLLDKAGASAPAD